jgi:hypothetical protein
MLIADTHVHIYPVHDAAMQIESAYANLARLREPGSADFSAALLLTERTDCHFYRDLKSGLSCPERFGPVESSAPGCLTLRHRKDGWSILLFSGRQIVTAEGIEVLALVTEQNFPDGRSIGAVIDAIRAAGGIPVLPWSPGKWSGRRGDIVRAQIVASGLLLAGDIAMRPCGLPAPAIMKTARRLARPIVAGTDPLPFAADAAQTGTYGIASRSFDARRPVDSLRAILASGDFTIVGRRNSLGVSAIRWLRNNRVRNA